MATAAVAENAGHLYFDSPIGRGPILRKYRQRAFNIWLTLALLGLVPSILGLSPEWRAFGLGMWFPGGGFLYTASPHWMLLSLALFLVSLAGWLIVGGFIFPILVWGGAAALAALDTQGTLWPWAQFVVPPLALAKVWHSLRKERRAMRAAVPRAAQLKEHLAKVPFEQPAATAPLGEPLADRELAALRYTLDLALQPIDEFEGFSTVDQFREAAWRYQLVTINYALGILQTSRTPAFRGYLYEAQRRAIVKMLDRRAWHYWRVENFLGNLKFEADPIRRENVMYSGWYALALGTFERATGDHQFSRPGALTLQEGRSKQYVYDYPKIVEVLGENFDGAELCFFACEPNWVFLTCNLYGMTGMLAYDREHGTRHGLDRLDRFNHVLEQEFTMAEGRSVNVLARRNGFIAAAPGPNAFMTNTQLINMTSPRLAQVYWSLFKLSLDEIFKGNLDNWQMRGIGRFDVGNYQDTGVFSWAYLMKSAREMGDEALYEFARQRYDAEGAEIIEGSLYGVGSTFAQVSAHMGSFATPGAWYRLVHGEVPASIRSGPILDDAPYPEVLVAFADNDGTSLDLELCAGTVAGLRDLKLARLDAGRRYRVTNTAAESESIFTADARGEAVITTPVSKRCRVKVEPA